MTALYEGSKSIHLTCRAHILDGSRELAWAEKHVVENPAHKWILGRYAEADRANSNRQLFAMDNLKIGAPRLTHAPLNINHDFPIVGAFVASEIVYPTGEDAAEGEEADLNPYMESLSVFWKHYFEDEYFIVETAHKAGRLFYSMECVPEKMGCTGEGSCGNYYEYAGRQHATYCDHLNDPKSGVLKDMVNPHFTAGALIIPPVRPGWARADIKQISELIKDHAEGAERLYAQVEAEFPESEPEMWEAVMASILQEAEGDS